MSEPEAGALAAEVAHDLGLKVEGMAMLAAQYAQHVLDALKAARVGGAGQVVYDPDTVISDDKMLQVALYAMRDLDRVNRDQEGRTAVSKYVGYIGFWFSKLKPVNSVWRLNAAIQGVDVTSASRVPDAREIIDINERMALIVMERVFWKLVYATPEAHPTVWQACKNASCELLTATGSMKGLCFQQKLSHFLEALEHRYQSYLIYSMRYRAGSPYLLVNFFEEALFFSCETACPPLLSKTVEEAAVIA